MREPRDWLHGEGGAWIAIAIAVALMGCSAFLWQSIA